MPCEVKNSERAGTDDESKKEQTKRKASSAPTGSPKKAKLFCSGTAYQPKAPANAIDFAGFIACVSPVRLSYQSKKEHFNVFIKTKPTSFAKITVSSTNKQFSAIRQNFLDYFHNKEPVTIKSCLPLNGRNFFNAYSFVQPCERQLTFNLNDADATPLNEIESNSITESIVGKLRFRGPVQVKPYTTRGGKARTDKMRECVISDGSTCLLITFWADFLDYIVEDKLIQLTNINSKTISNEIKLTTDPNSAICFLTEELTCGFENYEQDLIVPKNSIECVKCVVCIKKFETYQCCKNCKRRLQINSGTGMADCVCGRIFDTNQMNSSDEFKNVVATIEFKNSQDITLQATFFKDTLKALFEIMDDTKLKQKLLQMCDIDVHLNSKQIVAKTEACKH
ncbi:uncharacterized protein [Clytia hemisphaerica]|uniref:uncharacterized protein n=1 Tax=Clytia hemisphaerica TaxID=252671 RepID=UPI0034D3B4F5